jgi:hypothetical protein
MWVPLCVRGACAVDVRVHSRLVTWLSARLIRRVPARLVMGLSGCLVTGLPTCLVTGLCACLVAGLCACLVIGLCAGLVRRVPAGVVACLAVCVWGVGCGPLVGLAIVCLVERGKGGTGFGVLVGSLVDGLSLACLLTGLRRV